jgi:SAM-dependent methyltransferase
LFQSGSSPIQCIARPEAAAAIRSRFDAILVDEFDRLYLNSIGWRGIRQRRVLLEKLLRQTIEATHAAGQPVRILDIAAGAGRYVLETIQRGTVYVHCKIGYSRTAAAVAAYLLASGNARTPNEAMALLRRARPSIVIRPEAREAIVEYACERELAN